MTVIAWGGAGASAVMLTWHQKPPLRPSARATSHPLREGEDTANGVEAAVMQSNTENYPHPVSQPPFCCCRSPALPPRRGAYPP